MVRMLTLSWMAVSSLELGFKEVELEDEDTMYGNNNTMIQHSY